MMMNDLISNFFKWVGFFVVVVTLYTSAYFGCFGLYFGTVIVGLGLHSFDFWDGNKG
jgi:hypothetical protein